MKFQKQEIVLELEEGRFEEELEQPERQGTELSPDLNSVVVSCVREGLRTFPQCVVAVTQKARTFYKMADGPNEFQLEQPPSDGISSVKFSPTSASFLVVSSWDSVSIFALNISL